MNSLLDEVAAYYGAKFAEYGDTPRGADWNSVESQHLRFLQLCKIIGGDGFSINDLGCGYGALAEYLAEHFKNVIYQGIDISVQMIDSAKNRCRDIPNVHFSVSGKPFAKADYTVASGIFNVRQQRSDDEWLTYIHQTLDILNDSSTHGFSFNCLTRYSDANKKRKDLYYADPCALFDFCKTRYARNVALLHDYGLYEFTTLVRKS